jgi:hypothetical protein
LESSQWMFLASLSNQLTVDTQKFFLGSIFCSIGQCICFYGNTSCLIAVAL